MQAKMSSRGTSVLSITTLAGSGESNKVAILPATKINAGDKWLKDTQGIIREERRLSDYPRFKGGIG